MSTVPDAVQQAFETLELPDDATLPQARAAFRDLIAVWHPDKHPTSERLRSRAEAKTKQLNSAWAEIKRWFEGEIVRRAAREAGARREQEQRRAEAASQHVEANARAERVRERSQREERDRQAKLQEELQRRREEDEAKFIKMVRYLATARNELLTAKHEMTEATAAAESELASGGATEATAARLVTAGQAHERANGRLDRWIAAVAKLPSDSRRSEALTEARRVFAADFDYSRHNELVATLAKLAARRAKLGRVVAVGSFVVGNGLAIGVLNGLSGGAQDFCCNLAVLANVLVFCLLVWG